MQSVYKRDVWYSMSALDWTLPNTSNLPTPQDWRGTLSNTLFSILFSGIICLTVNILLLIPTPYKT